MQDDQASRTALLIAASLVLLRRDPKYSGLISKTSADLCTQMLEAHSTQTRLFLKIVRQGWFRPMARLIERVTIPGILLHYVLRKKCIAGLVRSALTNGATQVVVVGAGFDPTQRTFWIAEGLLMYLQPDKVSSLMKTLSTLSAPGSQVAFTFMEKQRDDRIQFNSQTKLVDWWLRRRGESFLWGTTRDQLIELVRPWRVIRFFDHDDLRQMESGLADELIAKGEVICLAEI